jgi:type IV pilus assembly protein PilP|tara:strand:+ start:276 stop:857 length:582 start_codon:yes stop_codon:yes gene_type:complete
MMNFHIQLNSFLRGAILLFICFFVSGCVSYNMPDLIQQVSAIMSRPGGGIDPIPEIKPYEAYVYESGKLDTRNPFKRFYIQEQSTVALDKQGPVDDGLTEEMRNEIQNRNREELERFELDSLRMVGTLQNEENNWGIVVDPGGIVHRVKTGNYVGLNIGRITSIAEEQIEVREIIKDNSGRYEERMVLLPLIE